MIPTISTTLRHYRDIRDATVYVPQGKPRRQGRPIPTIFKEKGKEATLVPDTVNLLQHATRSEQFHLAAIILHVQSKHLFSIELSIYAVSIELSKDAVRFSIQCAPYPSKHPNYQVIALLPPNCFAAFVSLS